MQYPHEHEDDIIYFAKTNFRNSLRKFGIKTDDRRRHTYVIGKTGMGKTTLLENMILSDIYAGHGCAYVDPHGDTAELLLDYIPSWRINDVVYFNPGDLEHPVGFNILESVDANMKHLVAAGMMSVFKKIWEGVWSARMEYILNNAILALIDNPGTTLLGINRMLSDEVYRKEIVSNVTDPIVKQFWVKEFASYQQKFATEAVAPIQNKVGQFLSAAIIRNIVAQANSSINVRKIMDEEKIFIVNLSKGRLGEDASRLLGGMLITKIQMSAMERVDTAKDDRTDFYLYVDEFQNFAVESFASILSEARKYKLNLVMAHQYIAQLTEEVRDAVFGNVGTLIAFRVGGPDAKFMEDEFLPRFTPEDIINLPKFNIYLKLMIDGVTSQPFSAATLPPIAQKTGSEERVIAQSRERYTTPRAKIEEKVAIWSGFGKDVDLDDEYAKAKTKKKEMKKQRFGHAYDCSGCKKNFQLPVELDRSRPIYCEDCMPKIKAEREKGRKGGGGRDRGRDQKPPRSDQGRQDRPREDRPRNDRPPRQDRPALAPQPKIENSKPIERKVGESISLSALAAPADKKEERKEPRKVPTSKPVAKQESRPVDAPTPLKFDQEKPRPKEAVLKQEEKPEQDQKSPQTSSESAGRQPRKRRRRRRKPEEDRRPRSETSNAAPAKSRPSGEISPLPPIKKTGE